MSYHADLKFLMTAVPHSGEFRPTRAEFVEMYADFMARGFRATHEQKDIGRFALFAPLFCIDEGKTVDKEAVTARDFKWMGSHQGGMNEIRNLLRELRHDAVAHPHHLHDVATEQRAWERIGVVCAHYVAMQLRLR